MFLCTTFLCLFLLLTDVREELEQFSSDIKHTADVIKVKLKGNLIKMFFFVLFFGRGGGLRRRDQVVIW